MLKFLFQRLKSFISGGRQLHAEVKNLLLAKSLEEPFSF